VQCDAVRKTVGLMRVPVQIVNRWPFEPTTTIAPTFG
jgi:hypothetical protein